MIKVPWFTWIGICLGFIFGCLLAAWSLSVAFQNEMDNLDKAPKVFILREKK